MEAYTPLPRTKTSSRPDDIMSYLSLTPEKPGSIRRIPSSIRLRFPTLRKKLPMKESAKKSAEMICTVFVGPDAIAPTSKNTQASRGVQLTKVRSQLSNPKFAKELILQLRKLELVTNTKAPLPVATDPRPDVGRGPIRAVCLDKVEAEAAEHHFDRLERPDGSSGPHLAGLFAEPVATLKLETIAPTLENLHIMDLIQNNFGIGQPASDKGLFAGSIPSAETVMTGIKLLTPQLMSLGYTSGQAILPNHEGVHPPPDRMSVLTYWWGFELVLPPPTLQYLSGAQSIQNAALNFLTVIASFNDGVRELLPFIRYISQFIEFEFKTILGQNTEKKGVVCAATWIMPIALVPRPWDFSTPPSTQTLLLGAPRGSSGGSSRTTPPSEENISANLDEVRGPSRSSLRPPSSSGPMRPSSFNRPRPYSFSNRGPEVGTSVTLCS